MKFCVDCKHCRPNMASPTNIAISVCALAEGPRGRYLVSGDEKDKEYEFCSVVRVTTGCGPKATWFEPKESA